MTAVTVLVLKFLMIVMAILGTALVLEQVFEPRRRRRNRYHMPYTREDDHRRVLRNAYKSRLGHK